MHRFLPCLALTLLLPLSVRASEPLAIQVTPFYDSRGPMVNVGPHSEGLASTDPGEVTAAIAAMRKEFDALPVAAMYVAAIRLFDMGKRDEALYWYYAAQFRGRWFREAVRELRPAIGDRAFELASAHSAFQELVGAPLNGYAGCDLEQWVAVLQRVRDEAARAPQFARAYPGLAFHDDRSIHASGQEIAAGLAEMADCLRENREEFLAGRRQNDADTRFCPR